MKTNYVTPKKCIHANQTLPKLYRRQKCSSEFIRFPESFGSCSPDGDDENAFILAVPKNRTATAYHKSLNKRFNLKYRSSKVLDDLFGLEASPMPRLDSLSPNPSQGGKFKLPMRPRLCSMSEHGAEYIPEVTDSAHFAIANLENLSIPDCF